MNQDVSRAMKAAIAASQDYTDKKIADRTKENAIGWVFLSLGYIVALTVANVLFMAWMSGLQTP